MHVMFVLHSTRTFSTVYKLQPKKGFSLAPLACLKVLFYADDIMETSYT